MPCGHVIYENLVKDPIQTIKNIYDQFNWEYTKEYDVSYHLLLSKSLLLIIMEPI
jgi:hypothetical protein